MRIPVSWLREMITLPVEVSGREIAERITNAGLEVESVETLGGGTSGPLVVGRVESIEELADFKKPIRFCQVDVGSLHGGVRGIVCGARNFEVGDLVVVALPGAVLPGDFVISARKTYGHVSDGMICSERELGLGEDHNGIMVLADGQVGDDAAASIGLGEEILDIAVTPDRGYALSVRGVAREVAILFGLPFADPGEDLAPLPAPSDAAAPWPCSVDDPTMCELFTLRRITGFNPAAPTPEWMKRRLSACGMRPVSLAVDVTNYVMIELGQPLHAFDGAKLRGAVRPGRAGTDTAFETLDHVRRTLDSRDIVIRDDTGVIGLAGTMGGLNSEIDDESTDIVLEAAWFVPQEVARTARRHKLSSEASRRFERGVDRVLAPYASARAAALLLEFGGGTYDGMTAWEAPYAPVDIAMAADLPARTAGMDIDRDTTVDLLERVGCTVDGDTAFTVRVPSWRPDLTDPADLVEEVVRLVGYDALPSRLPMAPAGYGLTRDQRMRRRLGYALAGLGVEEILSYPFIGEAELDGLGLAEGDSRRRGPVLANPLSDEQPMLRTTILPGLFAALRRNIARGNSDLSLGEIGRVFCLREGQSPTGITDPPRPGVADRPSDDHLQALQDLLPDQPMHLGVVLTGDRERAGWWGPGRPVDWSDAVEIATASAAVLGVDLSVEQADEAPFHPGRAARLYAGDMVVGLAGELHPRVVAALDLPSRTCALEVNVDALLSVAADVAPAPEVGTQPIAKEDLALVVDAAVPARAVEQALRDGAGDLLEDVRLFDVYVGPQVPEGSRSLAFALRLRAPDRTLSAQDIAAVREAAVAEAAARYGATLRGA